MENFIPNVATPLAELPVVTFCVHNSYPFLYRNWARSNWSISRQQCVSGKKGFVFIRTSSYVSVAAIASLYRNKPAGHDVDILITHPDEHKTAGLLVKLVAKLEQLVSGIPPQHTKNSLPTCALCCQPLSLLL